MNFIAIIKKEKIKITKKAGEFMPYIEKDLVNKLKKIDLYNYLKVVAPSELVHNGNGLYSTKTHDSLKISNGMWNWFSRR